MKDVELPDGTNVFLLTSLGRQLTKIRQNTKSIMNYKQIHKLLFFK